MCVLAIKRGQRIPALAIECTKALATAHPRRSHGSPTARLRLDHLEGGLRFAVGARKSPAPRLMDGGAGLEDREPHAEFSRVRPLNLGTESGSEGNGRVVAAFLHKGAGHVRILHKELRWEIIVNPYAEHSAGACVSALKVGLGVAALVIPKANGSNTARNNSHFFFV
jgi:hypothetical protein